mgnify:CR=1 FL=1
MNGFFRFFKSESIALIAAIGLAFTLFTGLESFLEFCQWLQPFVYYWRYFLYKVFDIVFFWLPFSLPNTIKEVFALAVLVLALVFRVENQYKNLPKTSNSSDWVEITGIVAFYYKTALLSTGIVVAVFLFPVLGWSPSEDRPSKSSWVDRYDWLTSFLPMTLRGAAATAIVGIIFFAGEKYESKIKVALFSKHMWRVVTVILALVFINYVGLYADKIRNWKENPPMPMTSMENTG